ncbi:MAG TPA: amino acid ABC transporter permease [Clostridia bacterium]|nr:amino acid ABC transporter permease [Clostridia bacterium]
MAGSDVLAFIERILPDLLRGAVITVELASMGLFLGLVLGLPTAFLRAYGKGLPKYIATLYVEAIRGTPLVVQLFIIHYGLPDLGLTFPRFVSAWLALGINSGAYQAEYFRGGIEAISAGQMAAAQALGMSRLQAIRHIILPQAFRLALPAWTNEAIYMVKYTSIAFMIAVPELLARGKMIISWYFRPTETLLAVAAIYLVILWVVARLMRLVENRFKIPGIGFETDQRA